MIVFSLQKWLLYFKNPKLEQILQVQIKPIIESKEWSSQWIFQFKQ